MPQKTRSIFQIDPKELKPYEKNPRKNAEAVEAVKRSLVEFGFQNPIIADKKLNVIAGHTRLKAAQALGLKEVPVLIADKLTPAQVKAYRIADNQTGNIAKWDFELLPLEIAELEADGFDVSLLGFPEDELGRITQTENEGLTDPDEIPEAPEAITKPGDLWLLGEHRLLCGDSTRAEDVARVMGGKRAVLMNTDPPYGVAYANEDRPKPGVAKPRVAKPRVANDTMQDAELQTFLEKSFKNAKTEALQINAAWYLWHAHLTQGFFAAAAAAAAAAVILHRQIIWVKPVMLLTRGQYHWKHEPCFMGWVEGNQPPDYGAGNKERNQTTVWEVGAIPSAERKELNHSTPKPVGLFTIPIVKHTLKSEICYEPFAGSGPQFIAAEQLNRKCYGLEISPQYCDVICKRWEQFTGKKAVLEKA